MKLTDIFATPMNSLLQQSHRLISSTRRHDELSQNSIVASRFDYSSRPRQHHDLPWLVGLDSALRELTYPSHDSSTAQLD